MSPEERDRLAKVEQKVENYGDWLRTIARDVSDIKAAANMGRGAWILLLKLGAVATAIVAGLMWVYEKLPHK